MNYNHSKIYTLNEIKSICSQVFSMYPRIEKAFLFGSYARGEQTNISDLDFMIELLDDSYESKKSEYEAAYDLEEIFQKQVDTITKNEAYEIMSKSIERDKVLVYDRERTD